MKIVEIFGSLFLLRIRFDIGGKEVQVWMKRFVLWSSQGSVERAGMEVLINWVVERELGDVCEDEKSGPQPEGCSDYDTIM